MVQELEADMFSKIPMGTLKERREAIKQPLEALGRYCEVKKHSDMGCAVVSFKDQSARDSVMRLAGEKTKSENGNDDRPTMKISGVDVQFRRHIDKATDDEIQNDIFVAWGRKEEKKCQLAAETIAEAIDLLLIESRGGQLTLEAPLPPPLHGLIGQQQQSPMFQQAQQPLTQLLLQNPMVPGPQQPQQDLLNYMNYWAAQQQQQQHAQAAMTALLQQQQQQQQNQQQQQPMQPPGSPQQQVSTLAQDGLQTPPPRQSPQGSQQMRSDAPTFTPPPVSLEQQFTDPSGYQLNELDYYGYPQNEMNQMVNPTKKTFAIVIPGTDKHIDVPTSPAMKNAEVPFALAEGFELPAMGRKVLPMKDQQGNEVNLRGMILTEHTSKKFEIIDKITGTKIIGHNKIQA